MHKLTHYCRHSSRCVKCSEDHRTEDCIKCCELLAKYSLCRCAHTDNGKADPFLSSKTKNQTKKLITALNKLKSNNIQTGILYIHTSSCSDNQ